MMGADVLGLVALTALDPPPRRAFANQGVSCAASLDACLDERNGDAAFLAKALDDLARAKGMAQVARAAGLARESRYKAPSDERRPGFDTILKVIGAPGLKFKSHAEAGES